MKVPTILKQRRFWIAFFIILYLLPVWLFKYFPTQDGPAHLYNAQILRDYASSDFFRQYLALRLTLFPNWLSHLLEWGLLYLFPALITEKIFLSLYVILFPLGFFYFLDAVQPGRTLLGFLSFLFIFNYLFLLGFYNFVLTIPLFLFLLGYWWKKREQLGWKQVVVCNLLLVAIFFGHLVSYALAVGSMGLLALIYFRKRVKPILFTLVCVLPSTLLFFNYYIGSRVAGSILPQLDGLRIVALLARLFELNILVSYTDLQQWIAGVVAVIMFLLFEYTVWKDLHEGSDKGKKYPNDRDYFLAPLLVFLVLYMILPSYIGPGGWLNDRLELFAVILLLALLRIGEGQRWDWLKGIIGMLVVANAIYLVFEIGSLNRGLEEYTSGISQLQAHKIILPLFFDGYGESRNIGIYVNASNYYSLDNQSLNLGNYEVQYDYFPVMLKPGFQTPTNNSDWVQTIFWQPEAIDLCGYASHVDYLLTWGAPDAQILDEIKRCYLPLYRQGRLALYTPRQ